MTSVAVFGRRVSELRRMAVIDTGTNSTRLLVAEVAPGGVREIFREAVITRLGARVDSSGRLDAAARERVAECAARYAATIGELGADRVMIIATSSVRDARDGKRFLASLARRFGFECRLLTGGEEAALSFAGAATVLAQGVKALVFDVGGGSTEVVVGSGAVEFAASMDLGCVRLRERFLSSDPAAADELNRAQDFADERLGRAIGRPIMEGVRESVGVAGTVTALAAIDLKLKSYDRELVHGHVLRRERVEALMKELARLTLEDRARIPTMEPGRADVIVAGAMIVSRLLNHLGVTEFMVSERDIMDGMALAMAEGRL